MVSRFLLPPNFSLRNKTFLNFSAEFFLQFYLKSIQVDGFNLSKNNQL